MKILLLGNCQGIVIQQIIDASGQHTVDRRMLQAVDADLLEDGFLSGFDLVLAQEIRPDFSELWNAVATHSNVVNLPFLTFHGFVPDQIGIQPRPGSGIAALDHMSRIMTAAWKRGFDPIQTKGLFNPEFVGAMGYYRTFDMRKEFFVESLGRFVPDAGHLFENWFARDIFFYSAGHPKSFIIEDVLRRVLKGQDITLPREGVSTYLQSPFAHLPTLPNLNHPAAINLLDRSDHLYMRGGRVMSLDEMIIHSFERLNASQDKIIFPEEILTVFDTAYAAWTGRVPEPMRNPYAGRPDWAFWSRSVARPAPAAVRPGDHLRPVIAPETRVATAGSCFAQHVARAMVSNGLTYYVAETAPETMEPETADARGYGLFSARYGNIYSTRQLLQLIRRAYGQFSPVETAWPVAGGYVDPFRPNIGETFVSVDAVEAARADHLAHVRRMFETLDVFVFTLGLTEVWLDRRDGAAYPVTPGAVTNAADPAHFEFANHDYPAVKADLVAFLAKLFAVNPTAQVILTVSPVPLIATYAAEDALSATTYSKSVLRAVAGDVATLFGAVQYFPSYEIITGGFNRGAYFAEDLRSVRPEGVEHVMRVFRERLVVDAASQGVTDAVAAPLEQGDRSIKAEIAEEISRQMRVVCDEELLVRKT